MPPWLGLLLSALLAYLLGSIPFSLLIAHLFGGFDLRARGSGNVGATNVARTMGARWGIAALTLDAIKGMVPVGLFPLLFLLPEPWVTHQRVLCGVMAVLGHMFPVWLGFRGGKGVATALGTVVVLAPLSTLIAFTLFAVSFAIRRIVSLSSMLAAVTFAVAQFTLFGSGMWSRSHWSLGTFSLAVPALILLRHHANIRRLFKGEEHALQIQSTEQPDSE